MHGIEAGERERSVLLCLAQGGRQPYTDEADSLKGSKTIQL